MPTEASVKPCCSVSLLLLIMDLDTEEVLLTSLDPFSEVLAANLDEEFFWPIYFYDIGFYVVVQLILMSILEATIIDSIIDTRVKREELVQDIEKKCFICGLSRSVIDREGEGWQVHIHKNHNVYIYMYFIIYIMEKDIGDCSSVEKHVKELIKLKDISFFPQSRSMSIKAHY